LLLRHHLRPGLFAKYLLVLVPMFLILSGLGLWLLLQFELKTKDEELGARIGNQTARAAAVLGRHDVVTDTGLARDLLSPLAADRAVECVELREVQIGRAHV
jgi:hypothetical protein